MNCPYCNSGSIQKRGTRNNKQQFQCNDCRKWHTIEIFDNELNGSYEEGNDFINIVCASRRMMSEEDLIRQYEIDTTKWEVERFKVKTSEGYRKDRSVTWHVKDGKVVNGHVKDSGKMLVVPLYHMELRLVKKTKEIEARTILEELKNEAKKFAPKYPTINYKKKKDGHLLEIDIPDLHFGKLTWREESGEDYDIKIAEELAISTIQDLIDKSSVYPIERILFPIGNDFFNVNNKLNITAHNTPQQEDTRWQKTFIAGRKLAIKMIDMLSSLAYVDAVIVPGNHDEERTFYLGDALECWYHKSVNVSVDNRAKKRKYYSYGKNLIGLTHGYYEKLDKLPLIMSLEEPKLWSESLHREWQTGDKHHKKEIKTSLRENENEGVMVRILRSLSANDAWHFDKGFIAPNRGAEAFVRHKEQGLVAQFISMVT